MMDSDSVEGAAGILWSAWQERRLIDGLPPGCRPRDLAEGYAVQAALAALAASPLLGWKIAATSRAGQLHIGVSEPLAGRLFERFARGDGATLAIGGNRMRVAEAEFAFRIGRDLPARDRAYTLDEVMAATDRLHVAIEVPDSRYVDYARAGAPQLVADDACASFFVLGPGAAAWRHIDLKRHKVTVSRNDMTVAEGSGAVVLDDPRLALTWLANDRAKRGDGLMAGQVVTTGTCIVPAAIAPGDVVVADFGELGRVGVRFVA
jgi:2-keto-4-pentenoate hydratase